MLRKLAKFFRRRARVIARFRAAQQGATVVEFALVAPALIAMLVAIFEVTLFLFAQQTLQSAAVQAGRIFMTGSAQNSGLTQAQFTSQVCPLVQAMFNCNNLLINVANYTSFSGASTAAPTLYNAQGQLNSGSFSAGTPGQVMVVQIAYPWPVLGAPLGFSLPNLGNGTTEIMGVTAFRVEPY
jgi:Flp pilus assembly protein TadG